MRPRALGLGLLWLALAGAAAVPPALLPLVAPPPDLAPLVPFAAAPLDKPPVRVPDLALPAPPAELPPLPLAPLVPPADKPTAFLPAPRALPCVGAWLRIASESLECGRARFGKGEYEDAARALEQAVRGGTDRDFLNEARYWLAETLYRLGRTEQADWLFRQVAHDGATGEFGVWGLHVSGWTAIQLRDAARARDTFTALLAKPLPAPLDVWARHGLALATYALGRYEEAEAAWASLESRGLAAALARDVLFWHGEALGRVGRYDRAVTELARFTQGGGHPLLEVGVLRQGWWNLAGGHARESLVSFRVYLAAPGAAGLAGVTSGSPERDFAQVGLAIALMATGDLQGARAAAGGLESRRSPLAEPLLLRLTRVALEASRPADARAVVQDLLAANVTPPARAWLLLVNGEAYRAEDNRDEARTQYDLAQHADPGSLTGRLAAFRVAQMNYELREFAQAVSDLAALLAAPVSPELRAAALLVQGEAAYQAGDYAAAGDAFRRLLVEFPSHPGARAARLGLAWTALRQRRDDEARRSFVEFAEAAPDDPDTPDALLLAAELAADSGDVTGARGLVERVLQTHPGHPRAPVARLDRAILMLRAGDAAGATPELRDWVSTAPVPPLLGRAHGALGVALLTAGQPGEAAKEFQRAQQEGVGAFAALGLGAAAQAAGQWAGAARAFTEARDGGSGAVAAAAEYGLAAVAFQRGAVREFEKPALAALEASPSGPTAPRLLYVLTGIAIEGKDWAGALGMAKRLVAAFPADEAADDALQRVGEGAATAKAWLVAYEALATLAQRYPASPFVEPGRVMLAEAGLETGRAEAARTALEQLVTATPADVRAWVVLGRAREAAGDRQGAIEAYTHAEVPGAPGDLASAARLGHARLLVQDKRWAEARGILEPLLRSEDRALVIEAATGLGDAYAGEGDQLAAAEYYMTAAYLAPESPAGRRALLGAASSFSALKQSDAAAVVYRKLLAQSDAPAELLDRARQGLKELGR